MFGAGPQGRPGRERLLHVLLELIGRNGRYCAGQADRWGHPALPRQPEPVQSAVADGCSSGTAGSQPDRSSASSDGGVITLAAPPVGRGRAVR